jgi:hypothetical protein
MAATEPSTRSARTGEVVVLQGLESASGAQLNGCVGVVGFYEPEGGRHVVEVVLATGKRKCVRLRAANMRPWVGTVLKPPVSGLSWRRHERVMAAFHSFITREQPLLMTLMSGRNEAGTVPLPLDPCVFGQVATSWEGDPGARACGWDGLTGFPAGRVGYTRDVRGWWWC